MPPLYVHVSHAEGLPALDASGTLDAYCVLSVEGFPTVERTQVIPRTRSPSWDEYFIFQHNFVGTEVLKISLFDKDILKDDSAGEIIVELSRVLKGTGGTNTDGKGITGWFPVQRKVGRVFLNIKFVEGDRDPSDEDAEAGVPMTPPTPTSIQDLIVPDLDSNDDAADDQDSDALKCTEMIMHAHPSKHRFTKIVRRDQKYFAVLIMNVPNIFWFHKQSEAVKFARNGGKKGKAPITTLFGGISADDGLLVRRQFVSTETDKGRRTLAIALCDPVSAEQVWIFRSIAGSRDTEEWFKLLYFLQHGNESIEQEETKTNKSKNIVSNRSSAMTDVPGDILQGSIVVNKVVKYCVLRYDRLVVFANRHAMEIAHSSVSGWDLMLDAVVEVEAKGGTSIVLFRSSVEAQVLQASDKAKRMLMGETAGGGEVGRASKANKRSRFVLTFSASALRDLWLKEIERTHRVWFASVRLWGALKSKDQSTVLELIDEGALVDGSNSKNRQLPVALAVENGIGASVVRTLLQKFPAGARQRQSNKDTLLHRACVQTEVDHETVAAVLAAYPVAASMASPTDKFHDTPLHHVARVGNLGLCNLILRASPLAAQQQNANQELPLHLVLQYSSKSAKLSSVESEEGEDIDDTASVHSNEITGDAKMYALRLTNIVEKLIALHPASAKVQTAAGDTPLHLAVANMSRGIVKRIAGASRECAAIANNDGDLPLHIGCRRAATAAGLGGTRQLAEYVGSLCEEAWEFQNNAGQTPEMLYPEGRPKPIEIIDPEPSISTKNVEPISPKLKVDMARATAVTLKSAELGWFGSLFACCGGYRNTSKNNGNSKAMLPPLHEDKFLEYDNENNNNNSNGSQYTLGRPRESSSGSSSETGTRSHLRLDTVSFLDHGRLPEAELCRISTDDLQFQEMESTQKLLREWNVVAKQLCEEFKAIHELSAEQLQIQHQLKEVVEHSDRLIVDAFDSVEAGLKETTQAREFSSNWLKVFQSKDSLIKSLIEKRVVKSASPTSSSH